jgi:hypothetical protein
VEPGSVDATVSDLAPETTYQVVTVGASGGSRVSGESVTVTTPPAGGDDDDDSSDDGTLAVTTDDPADVEPDGFVARGTVTDLGAAPEVEPGFEYWVEGRKAETLDDDDTFDLEEPGSYEESISFLEPGTTYVVRAVARHEDDVARGEQVTVRTSEANS